MMPCNIIGQDGGHDGMPEYMVQLSVSEKIG